MLLRLTDVVAKNPSEPAQLKVVTAPLSIRALITNEDNVCTPLFLIITEALNVLVHIR